MSNTSNPVVRYFRQLNVQSIFDPITYLGMEQRFIGALQKSGVNNFEEQYILGTNTVTESYIDNNGDQIKIKFFCKDTERDNAVNYYKIVSKIYAEGHQIYDNLSFDDNGNLKFSNNTKNIASFGTGITPLEKEEALYALDEGDLVFVDNSLRIYPLFFIVQKDILYYVNKDKEDEIVLVKLLLRGKKIEDNKNFIQEIIKYTDDE